MDSKKAIKDTLVYSDIFDYPLTFDQIYTFLISKEKYSKDTLKSALKTMKDVVQKDIYYVLKGREYLIEKRKQHVINSKQKLQKAKNIAALLSFIPTVLFIGVSGGVAVGNASKDDDIDFFIITKKNTVWITRLVLLFLLGITGALRTRNTENVSDKICLNMLLDETAIAFPKNKHDIYIAHEIVQVIPLRQRGRMFETFLQKNDWILQFLPNVLGKKVTVPSAKSLFVIYSIVEWCISIPLFEVVAKIIQYRKMKKHMTKEVVSSSTIAFHPKDYHENTLKLFNARI